MHVPATPAPVACAIPRGRALPAGGASHDSASGAGRARDAPVGNRPVRPAALSPTGARGPATAKRAALPSPPRGSTSSLAAGAVNGRTPGSYLSVGRPPSEPRSNPPAALPIGPPASFPDWPSSKPGWPRLPTIRRQGAQASQGMLGAVVL